MTTDAIETTDLSAMTISEVLALMPKGAGWRIVNSELANVTTESGRKGHVYWDDQDAVNSGWAYQLVETEGQPEETGEINDAADLANVFA